MKKAEVLMTPSNPIHSLPEEILIHIGTFLDAEDVGSCQKVAKSWHKALQDRSLWEELIRPLLLQFPDFERLEDPKKTYRLLYRLLYTNEEELNVHLEKTCAKMKMDDRIYFFHNSGLSKRHLMIGV